MSSNKKYYWLALGCNFFERKNVIELQSRYNGYIYTDILLKMYSKTVKNEFVFKSRLQLSLIECVAIITNHSVENVTEAFKLFLELGFIEILNEKEVKFIYHKNNRDMNTFEYKDWRESVFKRDKFTCRNCGVVGTKLNAHHIIRWVDDESKRYDVSNGLTLCVKCHKDVHKAVK